MPQRKERLERVKAEFGRRILVTRGIIPSGMIIHKLSYVQLVLAYLQAAAAFDRYEKHRRLPHRWHAIRREYEQHSSAKLRTV